MQRVTFRNLLDILIAFLLSSPSECSDYRSCPSESLSGNRRAGRLCADFLCPGECDRIRCDWDSPCRGSVFRRSDIRESMPSVQRQPRIVFPLLVIVRKNINGRLLSGGDLEDSERNGSPPCSPAWITATSSKHTQWPTSGKAADFSDVL